VNGLVCLPCSQVGGSLISGFCKFYPPSGGNHSYGVGRPSRGNPYGGVRIACFYEGGNPINGAAKPELWEGEIPAIEPGL